MVVVSGKLCPCEVQQRIKADYSFYGNWIEVLLKSYLRLYGKSSYNPVSKISQVEICMKTCTVASDERPKMPALLIVKITKFYYNLEEMSIFYTETAKPFSLSNCHSERTA